MRTFLTVILPALALAFALLMYLPLRGYPREYLTMGRRRMLRRVAWDRWRWRLATRLMRGTFGGPGRTVAYWPKGSATLYESPSGDVVLALESTAVRRGLELEAFSRDVPSSFPDVQVRLLLDLTPAGSRGVSAYLTPEQAATLGRALCDWAEGPV
jgi:hypothetical protein